MMRVRTVARMHRRPSGRRSKERRCFASAMAIRESRFAENQPRIVASLHPGYEGYGGTDMPLRRAQRIAGLGARVEHLIGQAFHPLAGQPFGRTATWRSRPPPCRRGR